MANEMSKESMAARIAELEARLAAKSAARVSFAVSKGGKAKDGTTYEGKGGIMVRGFGKWPITLYVEQWERFFEIVPELKAFVAEHREEALTINAAYRAAHGEDK